MRATIDGPHSDFHAQNDFWTESISYFLPSFAPAGEVVDEMKARVSNDERAAARSNAEELKKQLQQHVLVTPSMAQMKVWVAQSKRVEEAKRATAHAESSSTGENGGPDTPIPPSSAIGGA